MPRSALRPTAPRGGRGVRRAAIPADGWRRTPEEPPGRRRPRRTGPPSGFSASFPALDEGPFPVPGRQHEVQPCLNVGAVATREDPRGDAVGDLARRAGSGGRRAPLELDVEPDGAQVTERLLEDEVDLIAPVVSGASPERLQGHVDLAL